MAGLPKVNGRCFFSRISQEESGSALFIFRGKKILTFFRKGVNLKLMKPFPKKGEEFYLLLIKIFPAKGGEREKGGELRCLREKEVLLLLSLSWLSLLLVF